MAAAVAYNAPTQDKMHIFKTRPREMKEKMRAPKKT
jgi:hypothetical protein